VAAFTAIVVVGTPTAAAGSTAVAGFIAEELATTAEAGFTAAAVYVAVDVLTSRECSKTAVAERGVK
jgi:hypothetical protein